MLRALGIFSILFGLSFSATAEEPPFTSSIVGADLVCSAPGTVIHVNRAEERLWLSAPGSDVGLEPTVTKFLNTGDSSLFVKAEANLYEEMVDLVFTMRDVGVVGEELIFALRASLRIFDSSGEESAVLRLKCSKKE